MDGEGLEARIAALEAVEAIRLLKARYCALCDADYPPDELAVLFTEDAVWDGGPFGTHRGRAAIRAFFSGSADRVAFAIHHVTNSAIEVTGETATGTWYLWQPMVMRPGERALWLAARYEDRYVRTPEGWRFAHVRVVVRMLAPYEAGFGPERIITTPG